MVARRQTLGSDRAVSDAVDELIKLFGVLDDAIISAGGERFEQRRPSRLKDGGHGKGAGSASPDALWSKKRK